MTLSGKLPETSHLIFPPYMKLLEKYTADTSYVQYIPLSKGTHNRQMNEFNTADKIADVPPGYHPG